MTADPRDLQPWGRDFRVGLVLSQAVCAVVEGVQNTEGCCLAGNTQADLTDSNRKAGALVGELVVQPKCLPAVSLVGI